MRDMKTRFISFFLIMLTMSCFVACSSDDPAPEPEPEPEPEPVETVIRIKMRRYKRNRCPALNRRALYTYV